MVIQGARDGKPGMACSEWFFTPCTTTAQPTSFPLLNFFLSSIQFSLTMDFLKQ